MKTETIFFAEAKARSEVAKYWNARNDVMVERRMRQFGKLYAALLRRIEQGDRARAALRRLQDDLESYGASGEFCEAARLELSAYWVADKR